MTAKRAASTYAVWTTAWGPMGAAASDAGLVRVVLPHYSRGDLAELLAWEHSGAVEDEAPFADLIERSRAYFNGRRVDLADLPCVLPPARGLCGQVLRACRAIAYGQTTSYGRLAKELGRAEAARAVATCLSKNPLPLVIPCHRVTYSDGRPGGFSAPGGPQQKARMLTLERGCAAR